MILYEKKIQALQILRENKGEFPSILFAGQLSYDSESTTIQKKTDTFEKIKLKSI